MSTTNFDYFMETLQSSTKIKDLEQKQELLSCVTNYITESGVDATWVAGNII